MLFSSLDAGLNTREQLSACLFSGYKDSIIVVNQLTLQNTYYQLTQRPFMHDLLFMQKKNTYKYIIIVLMCDPQKQMKDVREEGS